MRPLHLLGLLCLPCLITGCATAPPKGTWIELFDGRGMTGWQRTDFAGGGAVRVAAGVLLLEPGAPFTGVNYRGTLPTSDYEVEVRATRLAGQDFFCCLTVPAGDRHCSLVVGGWGGRLVGISSIDDMDASENGTARFVDFENGRPYDIRLRIEPRRIQAWIDGRQLVDLDVTDHQLSVRWEVEPSRPFGIATYESRASIAKVRYRTLPPADPTTRAGEHAADR